MSPVLDKFRLDLDLERQGFVAAERRAGWLVSSAILGAVAAGTIAITLVSCGAAHAADKLTCTDSSGVDPIKQGMIKSVQAAGDRSYNLDETDVVVSDTTTLSSDEKSASCMANFKVVLVPRSATPKGNLPISIGSLKHYQLQISDDGGRIFTTVEPSSGVTVCFYNGKCREDQ